MAALSAEDARRQRATYKLQKPLTRQLAFQAVCIIMVAALMGDVVLYNRWSTSRPLVRVGSRVVTRGEYYGDLDRTAGSTVLNQIVLSEIVRQAAVAAHIPATDSDIDARLADLRRRHSQGVPLEDTPALREQTALSLDLEKLRTLNLSVSEAEIADYYASHKSEFALPTQLHNIVVITSNMADAVRATRMLRQGISSEVIATYTGMRVVGTNAAGFDLDSLPSAVSKPITAGLMSMKTGEVRTFPLGNLFVTFRVQERDDAVLPPLSQVHEEVALQVKLHKAPSEQDELARLYQANKPSFDMVNYAAYFRAFDSPRSSLLKQRTALRP